MSGFSLASYQDMLVSFKEVGYAFCAFDEIDQLLKEGRPFVALRHDIDISLRAALEIACIEHELGVQATYFVPLNSPFYNALSSFNAAILLQLHHMGHHIASHIDLRGYAGDCAAALTEVAILKRFYPFVDGRIVSLHSPLSLQSIDMDAFPQLKNVYGHFLAEKVAYISDSTGRWRYGHPFASSAFGAREPIQLLTHPIWWFQEEETPREKLEYWLRDDYLNGLTLAREYLPKFYSLEYKEIVSRGVG